VQPSSIVTINGTTLTSASIAGTANLYGNCGDPNNLLTCAFFGVGRVSANLTGFGDALTWNEAKNVNLSGITYSYRINGSTRSASAVAAARFQGSPWFLGQQLTGQISRFGVRQTITCPATCPRSPQRLPSPNALLKGVPEFNQSAMQNFDAAKRVPESGLGNSGIEIGFSQRATSNLINSLGFNLSSFDFSPLGQVRALLQNLNFYGATSFSGLGQFVDNLFTSYAASGRRFGFFPQAFNSDLYFGTMRFNSTNLFSRFNNPFPF
jgi:hypothetical protein